MDGAITVIIKCCNDFRVDRFVMHGQIGGCGGQGVLGCRPLELRVGCKRIINNKSSKRTFLGGRF